MYGKAFIFVLDAINNFECILTAIILQKFLKGFLRPPNGVNIVPFNKFREKDCMGATNY